MNYQLCKLNQPEGSNMPKWGKYIKILLEGMVHWSRAGSLDRPVPEDDSKACCMYCNTDIQAQLNQLKDHYGTKKKPQVSLCANFQVFHTISGTWWKSKHDKRRPNMQELATYVACHASISAVDDPSRWEHKIQRTKRVPGEYWWASIFSLLMKPLMFQWRDPEWNSGQWSLSVPSLDLSGFWTSVLMEYQLQQSVF